MPRRETEEAVARAAPIEAALAATGARDVAAHGPAAQLAGSGSGDPVAGELRRAGILPLLVLELLAQAPSYGNRLIDGIGELSGGLLAVNPNTMYPLLRRLEDDGLVTGSWEHEQRRSRRFYEITPAGELERERLREDVAPRLAAVALSVERLRAALEPGDPGPASHMSRARAGIEVPGRSVAQAEALWYDTARWASFVDGLAHIYAVEGEHPQAGVGRQVGVVPRRARARAASSVAGPRARPRAGLRRPGHADRAAARR